MTAVRKKEIQKLHIKRVNGIRDFTLDLTNKCNILVGENGQGKTTVLSIFNALITFNLNRLASLPYEALLVEMNDGDLCHLTRENLKALRFLTGIAKRIGLPRFIRMMSEMNEADSYGKFRRYLYEYDYVHSESSLRDFMNLKKNENFEDVILLAQVVGASTLYLPTYRRIEEDFAKFRSDSNSPFEDLKRAKRREDENLINFGMEDIEELINDITSTVKNIAISRFNTISFDLLNQLASSDESGAGVDQNNLGNIILAVGRIKEHLEPETRELIEGILDRKNIHKRKIGFNHVVIMMLLSKLGNLFDHTRIYDQKIHLFSETLNKYLINKKYQYDEQAVTLKIVSEKSELDLKKLSSGEKQLISLFAKLILTKESKSFSHVIIDEPELSLSIAWQRQLLPDILKSGKCDNLLVATHSPFVFDNDLKQFVRYVD